MKALFHCSACRLSTLCLCRLLWSLYFTFTCLSFLFFSYFCLSFFFSSPSLSLVVCENREEPWSWFQYLWWHQRPGEPLQTLRHGTTRPGLPANHSLPGFTSELPWKLLLVTAVFRLSVRPCVCLSVGQQLTWLTLSLWSHTTDCWKQQNNPSFWFKGGKEDWSVTN